MAVSNPSRGAKLSGARNERQAFALFPAAGAHHPRASRTHIFRKSRFRTGHLPVTVENDGDLHGDAALDAIETESMLVGFDWHSSSQARSNPREILYAVAGASFHAIESAIGSAEKLFRRVAILGKRGDAGADGKRGHFHFRGETFPNA
jgi:hypothetical protein